MTQPSSHVATVKNAATVIVMMKFGTEDLVDAVGSHITFSRQQHATKRSDEIQPIVGPEMRRKCGSKRACWIHAHAGQRRLHRNVCRHQQSREESCPSVERRPIRDNQHNQHEPERDHHFCGKRDHPSAKSRHRHNIVDGGMLNCQARDLSCQPESNSSSQKLRRGHTRRHLHL